MSYLYIIFLLLCYLMGIQGMKAQYLTYKYPASTYTALAVQYGRYYLILFGALFISSFVVSMWSWWVELLVLLGTIPVSMLFGYLLAEGQHKHETDFRTPDDKGTDIAKMAEHYRKKAGK